MSGDIRLCTDGRSDGSHSGNCQMSKGPWDRCQTSGLPMKRLDSVDRSYLDAEGNIDPAKFQGCNLFAANSAAVEAGASETHASRMVQRMLGDPRFHHYEIRDVAGNLIGIPTHEHSAQAWGRMDAVDRQANSLANLRRGLKGGTAPSDVTCGTSAKDVTGA